MKPKYLAQMKQTSPVSSQRKRVKETTAQTTYYGHLISLEFHPNWAHLLTKVYRISLFVGTAERIWLAEGT